MLTDPTIEKLLPRVENRYILAMLTAKRARQLVDGGKPMAGEGVKNTVSIAAHELSADHLKFLHGKHEVQVPLRPEVEAERLEAERLARAKREEALMEEGRHAEGPSFLQRLDEEQAENELRQSESLREFSEQIMQFFGQQDDEAEDNADQKPEQNTPEEEL